MARQLYSESVRRTFALLNVLSKRSRGASLDTVMRETGLSKTTAYRYLRDLHVLGYIVRNVNEDNLKDVRWKVNLQKISEDVLGITAAGQRSAGGGS